jgi:predicted transcriptional regulator
MVSPNYAIRRRELAVSIGLGRGAKATNVSEAEAPAAELPSTEE